MNVVSYVAELMSAAAITSPKAKGSNFVEVKILEGEILKEIAVRMVEYGIKTGKKNFDRDGKNVANSEAVVLIGLKNTDTGGLNCGACGYPDCNSFLKHTPVDVEFKGPTCAYRLLDMGIAIGSAVKIAAMMNIDNRVMYRVAVIARDMKLVDWDFVIGIPLSISGKSIYFDR